MTFINDNNSREIQQVYLNILHNIKPLPFDRKWNDDNNEETQNTENSYQPDPKQNNYSSAKPSRNYSPSSNNLTPSSSQNNSNSSQISLKKEKKHSNSEQPSSLLFKVTQNGKFVDEIEMNKDGIKSKKSTDYSDRLLAQIEILQSLPEGTIIPSAPSIQVRSFEKQGDKILSEQVLLSTDQQGKITKNTITPSPQKTGTQVINEQLDFIRDKSLAQDLNKLIIDCINKQRHSLSPDLQSVREQEPHNVKWWQQAFQKGGQWLSDFAKEHQHKQVAKKLYYLFSKNAKSGNDRFSENGYTIIRQPLGEQHRYTVFNANNQPVLTFDVNQQKRLSIINNNLTADDSKALMNLGQFKINIHRQEHLQNPALMTRANRVADTLVQMAQQQQQSIRRAGHSYTLAIDLNGDVEISAPGRGVIYHQTRQGDTPIATNLMTEADLTFFERQFSSQQQPSKSSVQTPTSTQTPTPTRSRRR
ncbi:hypothetical protein [Crocosphaera chwakensis]|uniref:Uncharacterized protein n=1 Tax=Crocosphaera chwakensis CCY0110 TaxID=391612 RepID=A3IYK8_9CHRO|nr:hypothetical protein [Crocosphaera chwakensis]EAZ88457.1 hypothetical protein CY0110_31220 [Crocosphaera chwakensis CCY0110]